MLYCNRDGFSEGMMVGDLRRAVGFVDGNVKEAKVGRYVGKSVGRFGGNFVDALVV